MSDKKPFLTSSGRERTGSARDRGRLPELWLPPICDAVQYIVNTFQPYLSLHTHRLRGYIKKKCQCKSGFVHKLYGISIHEFWKVDWGAAWRRRLLWREREKKIDLTVTDNLQLLLKRVSFRDYTATPLVTLRKNIKKHTWCHWVFHNFDDP